MPLNRAECLTRMQLKEFSRLTAVDCIGALEDVNGVIFSHTVLMMFSRTVELIETTFHSQSTWGPLTNRMNNA